MTLAHQCQIAQLKDSFKDKLKLNDDWVDKLSFELNKQRDKYVNEMQIMESDLRKNFNSELNINQQKYGEMVLKYQNLKKEYDQTSRSKISSLELEKQRLLSELRNLHDEKIEKEDKLRKELENLRKITKELHEKLGYTRMIFL